MLLVQRLVRPSPGHWRSRQFSCIPAPTVSRFCPPCTRHWVSASRAWGRASASFSLPCGSARPVGRGRASSISQAGPRGMCRLILPWRIGGPEIRPFFCSLYLILKLYLMLLYERGRGGDRADPITFMCKCLIYYACIRDKL
jgi:hypothetical protein